MQVRNSTLSATAIICLSGCTSLHTSTEPIGGPASDPDNKATVGLYYFLPKALFTIEGQSAPDDKDVFQVTVTRTMVADQRHRYLLRWTQNPFYDDKIATTGVTVTDQGLLTSVPFTATDQSPAIVNDLATTAVNVFKILGHGGGAVTQAISKKNGQEAVALHPFKYTFDPLDVGETNQVEGALSRFNIDMVVCPPRHVTQSCIGASIIPVDSKNAAISMADTGKDHPPTGGVLFHPPITVEMRFDLRPAGADVIHRETIMVPDPERVGCFRFGRSPFVSRDTALTLVAGMPTAFSIDRPSPIKAFTGLLSTVTGTIAAAIPTIVNVKENRQLADISAQKQLVDAQAGLLNSQSTLATALAKTTGGTSGSTPGKKTSTQSIVPGLNAEATTEALNALGKTASTQREQLKVQRETFIKDLHDRKVPDDQINQKLKDGGFDPLP